MTRVLLHNDKTDNMAAKLRARCPGAQIETCNTYAELPDKIRTFRPDAVYTVRFAGTPAYPRAALFGDDGPAWIANGGAGTDHFGSWDTSRVTVTNAAGVAADMMAEYVMGGFLNFTLDVPGLQADKTAQRWQARTVRPLKGQTLLVVGLGHTGRAIASRAKAFGMHVLGTRAHPQDMLNVDEVHPSDALPSLMGRADFIAVSTPLTQHTKGLIGRSAFARIKPGAILADVSRGGVVDQTAMYAALQDGSLAAAILDVFETEPLPTDSPLWDLENVILSPHCSSVYDGWEEASFDLFLTNLEHWIAGRPLMNVVNPDRGY